MAARPRSEREPIRRGDIVDHAGHSWDVMEVSTESPVTLQLERVKSVEAPTPYGKPQRYRRVKVRKRADEGRCLLVGRQPSLFDADPTARNSPFA